MDFSVDITEKEVLNAVSEYLEKKYKTEFASGSLRPCYDKGFGFCKSVTGYNFTGTTKE